MRLKNIKGFRIFNFNGHILQTFIWLAALGAVVMLFQKRVQRFQLVGIAQGQQRQIAATSTGRLKSLHVELFDPVVKEQVVAALDNSLLTAELATTQAEIERLQAELIATQDQLEVESADKDSQTITEHRRFAMDIEQSRLEILKLRAAIEPDLILLKNLQVEIDIENNLLQKGTIAAEYGLAKAQTQYDTLAKRIEENQNLLAQARLDFAKAEKRLVDFKEQELIYATVEVALEPIRRAINIQEKQIEELVLQSSTLILKSPFEGVVSQIFIRVGEAVLPGVPILTIIETTPTEIVAYTDEKQTDSLREGQRVELIKGGTEPKVAYSQVVSVGPAVELMPERLWRTPNVPQYGRPLLIKIPPELKLIPGEMVGVRGA